MLLLPSRGFSSKLGAIPYLETLLLFAPAKGHAHTRENASPTSIQHAFIDPPNTAMRILECANTSSQCYKRTSATFRKHTNLVP
jgi:hypothetical protein